MELNRIVFPSPPASYTYDTFKGKLIFVPKQEKPSEPTRVNISTQKSTDISATSLNYLPKNELLRNTLDQIDSVKKSLIISNAVQKFRHNLQGESGDYSKIINKRKFTNKESQKHAAKPYSFVPLNGAPSVKGKKL